MTPALATSLVVGQVEPGGVGDRVERGEGTLGPLGLGEVLRHVDREPERVATGLTETQARAAPGRLAGTCTWPNGDSLSPTRRGSVACAVIPTGRVCGTPMGMPWLVTTRVIPRIWMSLADRLDRPLPLEVRLGTREQVVGLAVAVAHAVEHHRRVGVGSPSGWCRTPSPGGVRGSRAARRRRTSRRPPRGRCRRGGCRGCAGCCRRR